MSGNFVSYEQLGFSNDFMFGKLMQNEQLCKPFLEQVLGIDIHHLVYLERQKTIDEKIDGRSVRLDIYAHDGKTVYNCEMQTSPNRNLPKRTRYYQGQIDMNLISKGTDYEDLKKTFIIFVCTYDPFGKGRYLYTFRNHCVEDLSLELGDETVKVFLNSKGHNGEIEAPLRELLEYIEFGEIPQNCQNPLVYDLEAAVQNARESKEWRREFMTLEMLKQDCRKDGLIEGRAEGRAEGREEMIRFMLLDGMTPEQIARIAKMSVEDIEAIKKRCDM